MRTLDVAAAPATKTALELMLEKAAAQLADIRDAEQETHVQYDEHQAERERIREHAQGRESELAHVRSTAQKLHMAVTNAVNYAALSQGTPNEKKAVRELRDLQKSQQTLDKQLADLESKAQKEESEEAVRLSAIADSMAACQQKVLDLQQKRADIESAQLRAHREHVEALGRDMVIRLELHQAAIDAKRKELTTAQIAMEEVLDEARALMKEWPGTGEMLRSWLPFEDVNTRVLEKELEYITILLDERNNIAQRLPVTAVNGFFTWFQLLAVPDNELYIYENLTGNPTRLRQRQARVSDALKEWKARNI